MLMLASLSIAHLAIAAPENRDAFGGWTERTFEATGYFRSEWADERWWLVTPEGNAFVIHGMDHCGQHVTNHDNNREHWNQEWGLGDNPKPADRLRAFYRNKFASDREYLGFNAVYSHSAPVGMNVVPYIPRANTLKIEYWRTHNLRKQNPPWSEENFLDVFAPSFEAAIRATGERMINPFLPAWD